MIEIRTLELARDRDALALIDTTFETDVVLDVIASATGFALVERAIDPPLRKGYAIDDAMLAGATHAIVAERAGRIIGVGALAMRAWNARAEVTHLYVDRGARWCGVGGALLGALRGRATSLGARCLWLETQNVNVPAIRFYQRAGLELCGLDTTLYDPREAAGEVALYFAGPV